MKQNIFSKAFLFDSFYSKGVVQKSDSDWMPSAGKHWKGILPSECLFFCHLMSFMWKIDLTLDVQIHKCSRQTSNCGGNKNKFFCTALICLPEGDCWQRFPAGFLSFFWPVVSPASLLSRNSSLYTSSMGHTSITPVCTPKYRALCISV